MLRSFIMSSSVTCKIQALETCLSAGWGSAGASSWVYFVVITFKSDILIRLSSYSAWVTTAHISTLVGDVRSNLIVRWSYSQPRQFLPLLWPNAASFAWQGQDMLYRQGTGILCQLRKRSHQSAICRKIHCSKNLGGVKKLKTDNKPLLRIFLFCFVFFCWNFLLL